jgi:WD40 repeat protein
MGEAISSLSWASDGSSLAVTTLGGEASVVSSDGEQNVWLPAHDGAALAASWSADATRLAVGGQDGRVDVCEPSSWALRHHVFLEERIGALAWSPDGWLAVAAGPRVIAMAPEQSRRFEAPAQPGTVEGLLWTPSHWAGSTPAPLAVAGVGGIGWYDVPFDDRPVETWTTDGAVLALALAPTGTQLATGNLNGMALSVSLVDDHTAELRHCYDSVSQVSWSAGGDRLAVVAGHDLTVWRLDGSASTTPESRRLRGHHGPISDAAFSPTGAVIASVGVDGNLVLWSPDDTPDPLERIDVGEEATCVDWGPDGGALATGSVGGAVQVFAVRPGPWRGRQHDH